MVEKLRVDFLYDYNKCKSEGMSAEDELKYSFFCVPGPSQYNAFSGLFDLFKEKENIINSPSAKEFQYAYDCQFMDERGSSTMQFLTNLVSHYDVKNKNIIMTSGSFWKDRPSIRQKMISLFNQLDAKGANVLIYTQAGVNEEYMNDISKSVLEKSKFDLQERIAIHYIQADEDFILVEFPHTEITDFRLNWLLDLNRIEIKNGKSCLLQYFDSLIRRVL